MLLTKSKLNHQKRKYERKKHKQKIEELNKKLGNLTQAVEILKTPNS